MKKWFKYWPYALNIILFLTLVSILKKEEPKLADLSIYTQQDIDKAFGVKSGMSFDEVKDILGIPVKKEISGDVEEWHYCRTGSDVDEYVAIKFESGKVYILEQYTVSYLDIIFHHTSTPSAETIKASGMGDCKLTIRWGSYGEKKPNQKTQPTSVNAG
ncbi:hypothetical protein SOV92_10980 [Pectobacterium brasiliense]|uniref:Lipoprotein SmpA/OmlA domain-containing protein n=1 Tax=Pectobacterium brasiliense TaxID=180957 RepID=A0AAW9HAZ6_9GAMM|nr:hypothetical protein [Pectobacterium brasiliense]MDY4378343.1 hypothetical protein [Pectobacterium brasiliense]